MQKELAKYSKKDNELIIKGVQDLFRSFNEEIITKQNEKDIFNFKFEDFELVNYQCHPAIKAPVAV